MCHPTHRYYQGENFTMVQRGQEHGNRDFKASQKLETKRYCILTIFATFNFMFCVVLCFAASLSAWMGLKAEEVLLDRKEKRMEKNKLEATLEMNTNSCIDKIYSGASHDLNNHTSMNEVT